MKVAIIGLGLIGGSIARRLRGFHNCTISAYNRTSETVLLAKQDGAIDEGSSDVGEVMDNADLIILIRSLMSIWLKTTCRTSNRVRL